MNTKSLSELFESVKNFNARDLEDTTNRKGEQYTKELLQEEYCALKKVYDTLDVFELRLLWFLRNSGIGVENRFYDCTECRYKLSQCFVDLDREICRYIDDSVEAQLQDNPTSE